MDDEDVGLVGVPFLDVGEKHATAWGIPEGRYVLLQALQHIGENWQSEAILNICEQLRGWTGIADEAAAWLNGGGGDES